MGLQLVPHNLNIDFVGRRKLFYLVSCVALLVSLGVLVLGGGPKYGIDFAGGTVAQVKFTKPVALETLYATLAPIEQPGMVVQSFGDDGLSFLIRFSTDQSGGESLRRDITAALLTLDKDNPEIIQRLESVGPKVGADLRSKAIEAMYFATLFIAIYISWRFEHRWFTAALMAGGLIGSVYLLTLIGVPKAIIIFAATVIMVALCWKLKFIYALGVIVSILHDVLITVGVFVLMGKEFDLTIVAALLTVLGYSINDTIIVYDRIRENLQTQKVTDLAGTINRSINQTLSRTVLTSLTTLFVITSLLLFGGGIIHDFALVLLIGVLVGTYSSIFVASPMLMLFGRTVLDQAEAIKTEKEEAAKRARSRDMVNGSV
ncbi:MAG: Protein translocase subunit SecF [Desulfovibrio sp.]